MFQHLPGAIEEILKILRILGVLAKISSGYIRRSVTA
jgi:hypothetical protein